MMRQLWAGTGPDKMGRGSLLTLLLLLIVASLVTLLPPRLAQAASGLELDGPGVEIPARFTMPELEALEQYEQVYSAINTYPTKQWYIARGVKLRDVLAPARLKDEASLMRFYSRDGYSVTFTVKELLEDKRYYFPGLMENHRSDGSILGCPEGAVEVEPVLALLSAEGSDNPEHMNDKDTLLLVLGQRAISEQVSPLFVKRVNRIEVLTENPGQWDQPRLNVPTGSSLPPGTGLMLENKNSDADKIYYTTDGSKPTIHSPIFNWSASRWWPLRGDLAAVNAPIKITKEMVTHSDGQDQVVIKARTIGPGKEDSEVATFTLVVDPTAADPTLEPGSQATGLTLDQSRLELSPGSAYYLQALVEPFNAADKGVTWESSDTSVATVDTKGLVTMVGPGKAIITARTKDGSHSASCVIDGSDQEDEEEKEEDGKRGEQPAALAGADDGPPPAVKGETKAELSKSGAEPEAPNLVPEHQQQFLAAKKDFVHPPSKTGVGPVETAASELQVFELIPIQTAAAVEAVEPDLYTILIFLLLFCSGAGKKYLEYVKEL